jgi:hypothetical protein
MAQLWIGSEEEGTLHRGQKTLFVKGILPDERIEKHLSKVERIYFGAGNDFDVDLDQVARFAKVKPCTLETDKDIFLPSVFVIRKVGHLPDAIKTVHDGIVFIAYVNKVHPTRAPEGDQFPNDWVLE